MSITDDPNHPGVKRGYPDESPAPMHEAYLVLSEEERAKGFVRPVRHSYRHVGIAGPQSDTRDLTEKELDRWKNDSDPYVKFEPYPAVDGSAIGRFWTQKQLDSVGKGCGTVTTMGHAIAETYARKPGFYGSTYCVACSMHRAVGEDGEFVWEGTDERVGT